MTEKIISLVRPFITLFAVVGLTLGFFTDRVTSEAYVPLMAMAIAWWFRARDTEKQSVPPETPTIIDKRGA